MRLDGLEGLCLRSVGLWDYTHAAFSLTVTRAELNHAATLNSSPLPFSAASTSTFAEEHVLPQSF